MKRDAPSREALLANLHRVCRDEMRAHFRTELEDMWEGRLGMGIEGVNHALDGTPIYIKLARGAQSGCSAQVAGGDENNQFCGGVPLSFSVGSATAYTGMTLGEALKLADARMYAAKRAYYDNRPGEQSMVGRGP